MSDERTACAATTKNGAPCRNSARPGSRYCHVHRTLESTATAPDLHSFVADVNQLAEELRRAEPTYNPPPYSPQGLLAMLQQNVDRLTPDLPLLTELRHNLQGTKPQDLVDPDTWKGLWYILNYTAQAQSRQTLEKLEERIAAIPGGQMLLSLKSGFEGASPRDLLDVQTWKGAWFILNSTVRAQANDLKRRVLGDSE